MASGSWLPLFAAAPAKADKLPEPTRTMVLMALLGIVLAGMLIVVFVLLGGSWVRRLGSHRRGPSIPPDREPLDRHADPLAGGPRLSSGRRAPLPDDTVDEVTDFGETKID